MRPLPDISGSGSPAERFGPILSSTSRSHVGHVRQLNEDRILERPDRALWAVADGMGGHRGGDIAAELAIGALRALADRDRTIDAGAILGALEQANSEIFRRAQTVGGTIGSTIVAMHIAGGRAELFWAGDSRAYLERGAECSQLTSDHSLVQQLIDAEAIDRVEAARHPQAHVITRALGAEAEIDIETVSFEIRLHDVLLLCSDGLSRAIDLCALNGPRSADGAAADRLLAEALRRDGSDNVSFVVVSVDNTGED